MERIQKNTAVILPHRDRTQRQAGTRNLYHTTHHYTRLLPGITTVVVEQDERSRVDPQNLPPGCQHVLALATTGLNLPVIVFEHCDP
jgi:hypothetical protein